MAFLITGFVPTIQPLWLSQGEEGGKGALPWPWSNVFQDVLQNENFGSITHQREISSELRGQLYLTQYGASVD